MSFKTAMSCRGLAFVQRSLSPGSSFILARFYGFRPWRSGLGGASIVSSVESHLHLLKELWLAIDEVVHHDDVMVLIVIRSRGNVSGLDQDRRNAGVVKLDPEEGQVSIAW